MAAVQSKLKLIICLQKGGVRPVRPVCRIWWISGTNTLWLKFIMQKTVCIWYNKCVWWRFFQENGAIRRKVQGLSEKAFRKRESLKNFAGPMLLSWFKREWQPMLFRHTFCTNMASAGMDIKNLQYVMGHSDVGVTLNVYTHASFDRAAEQMAKILVFSAVTAWKIRSNPQLVLHQLLHHLPVKLRRNPQICVGSMAAAVKGKRPKVSDANGLKAYEGIDQRWQKYCLFAMAISAVPPWLRV